MRAGRSSTLPIVVLDRPAEPPKVRWRLDIAYDGTDFSGWAAQAGLRTVQGELETWIARVLRLHEQPPTGCAAGPMPVSMREGKSPTSTWTQR